MIRFHKMMLLVMIDLITISIFIQGLWNIDVIMSTVVSLAPDSEAYGYNWVRNISEQYHFGLILNFVMFFAVLSALNCHILWKEFGYEKGS